MKNCFYTLLLIAFIASCTETADKERNINGLAGTWRLRQVYLNDHWGGPLYWKDTAGSDMKLTKDQYFIQNDDKTFELAGTYIVNNDVIQITPLKTAADTSKIIYTYLFDDNRLIFQKNQLEGIVAYKFQLIE